jgi:hypothetical protein
MATRAQSFSRYTLLFRAQMIAHDRRLLGGDRLVLEPIVVSNLDANSSGCSQCRF